MKKTEHIIIAVAALCVIGFGVVMTWAAHSLNSFAFTLMVGAIDLCLIVLLLALLAVAAEKPQQNGVDLPLGHPDRT